MGKKFWGCLGLINVGLAGWVFTSKTPLMGIINLCIAAFCAYFFFFKSD